MPYPDYANADSTDSGLAQTTASEDGAGGMLHAPSNQDLPISTHASTIDEILYRNAGGLGMGAGASVGTGAGVGVAVLGGAGGGGPAASGAGGAGNPSVVGAFPSFTSRASVGAVGSSGAVGGGPGPRLTRNESNAGGTAVSLGRTGSQFGTQFGQLSRQRTASIVAQLSTLPLMTRQMSGVGVEATLGSTGPGTSGEDDNQAATAAAVVEELQKKELANEQADISQIQEKLSSVIQRRRIYLQLSFIVCAILFGVTLFEYIVVFGLEQTPITTRYLYSFLVRNRLRDYGNITQWTLMLGEQVLHVFSFYLFLISFVYANESGDVKWFYESGICGCFNVATFIFRVVLDLGFNGYFRPTELA